MIKKFYTEAKLAKAQYKWKTLEEEKLPPTPQRYVILAGVDIWPYHKKNGIDCVTTDTDFYFTEDDIIHIIDPNHPIRDNYMRVSLKDKDDYLFVDVPKKEVYKVGLTKLIKSEKNIPEYEYTKTKFIKERYG